MAITRAIRAKTATTAPPMKVRQPFIGIPEKAKDLISEMIPGE
jgi:hypothetical protein